VAGIRSPADKPAEPPINQSLRVSWLQWRGPAIVKFEPRVVRVADGASEGLSHHPSQKKSAGRGNYSIQTIV
jgi:hypothetical protein